MISNGSVCFMSYPEYEINFELVGDKNYLHIDIHIWNKHVYKELKEALTLYDDKTNGAILYATIVSESVAKFATRFGFKPTGVELELRTKQDNAYMHAYEYIREI